MIKSTLILMLIFGTKLCSAFDYEGVTPLFVYAEWSKINYYTNLTPSTDNNTLFLDQNENGYKINRKINLGASLGYTGRISENTNPLTNINIGLVPVFKTEVNFVNHVANFDEAEKLNYIMPFNEETLDRYKNNDSAEFELEGGVIYHLGSTFGLLNIGANVMKIGGWSCFVEKVSNDIIYVELYKIRDLNKAYYANATFPYFEKGSIKEEINTFAYFINYKTEEGMAAYKQFLKGHLNEIIPIENVVTEVKKSRLDKKAKYVRKGVGIPYVPLLNATNYTEQSDSHEWIKDLHNNETESNYTISLQRRDIKVFKYTKVIDTAFLISQSQGLTQMQLFFKYSSNFSRSNKISNIRDTLIKLTGLKDFVDFKIKDEEKLNYAEVKLSVNFGKKIVDTITQNKESFLILLNELKNNINNTTDLEKASLLIDNLNKSNFDQKAQAAFGQKFWSSPILFKFAVNLIQNCGGDLSYEVSGKRISRIIRNQTFELSDECPLN